MFWKELEPVVRLELRVEASSSWFVELFVLHFVSRLGATHRPLRGGGSSGKRSIDGKDRRLVSPARVEKRGRIRGSSGRITAIGSSLLSMEPGSGQVEDHTRWKGSSQALSFSSPVLRAGAR